MHEPTDRGVAKRWRALWETSPQRSPFSTLEYVRATADAGGLRTAVFFAGTEDRHTAGMAIPWRRRGPYREAVLPPFTPFSALLLRKPMSEADVHARSTPLDDLLDQVGDAFHAGRLSLPPSITDVRPAQWQGWSAQPLYTYRVSSPSTDRWSSSTARNFRTARDGYSLVMGDDAAEAAVDLAAGSYARQDRALPLKAELVRELVETVVDAGLANAFAARAEASGRIDAAVVVAASGSSAYYWIAGSRPGDAMTALIGLMLPELFDAGVETFDFVGANTPSIAEFKRRFGAKLVPYYHIECFSRADLKLLYTFKKMLR